MKILMMIIIIMVMIFKTILCEKQAAQYTVMPVDAASLGEFMHGSTVDLDMRLEGLSCTRDQVCFEPTNI